MFQSSRGLAGSDLQPSKRQIRFNRSLVPDLSTLCRRQRTVAIRIPFRRGSCSLNLLVDSAGVTMRGDGEWQVRSHGASRRQ